MRAIQISEFGGPEVLQVVDLPEPEPGEGQLRVRVTRAGVNYADTHATENSYLSPTSLPLVPGAEVAGVTDDGRRVVAFVTGGGGYAEYAVAPESLVFEIPDGIDDGAALALLLQGLTAWHLLRTSARLDEGESVVVHAAAGGVGSLAVQLAGLWEAGCVIGTASSAEKRALAEELGAHVTVDPAVEDLKGALIAANGGRKLDVVLEMTGGRVFDQSLSALAPFGRVVFFGMASRTLPQPIQPPLLMQHSAGVVGFWLAHCFQRPGMLGPPLAELFELTLAERLRPVVGATYPLAEARRAHEDLLARRSRGKLLLDPTA